MPSIDIFKTEKMTLDQINKMHESFFEMRQIPVQYKVSDSNMIFGYIYVIENMLNGKKYVGKASNLRVRVSQYIRDYNNPSKHQRPILKALVDDGIENFKMYPICEFDTDRNGMLAEKYFIRSLNTIDPQYGYNKSITSGPIVQKSYNRPMGIRASADAKLKRSRKIIAVRGNSMIIADSAKLFGDYLGGYTRDLISHTTNKPCRFKEYFIFFIDSDDRKRILDKYTKKMNVYINDFGHPKREVIKAFNEYSDIYDDIEQLQFDGDRSDELKLSYDIYHLSYDSTRESGYTCFKIN